MLGIFGLDEPTESGMAIDEVVAMNYSAVYAAVGLIAQSLAVMPLKVYKRLKSGKREEITDHPACMITGWSPDGEMPSFNWRETMSAHAVLRGNAVSEVTRNWRGQAAEAHLLDPRTVQFCRSETTGKRLYKIGVDDVSLHASQVIHIPALSWDGYVGKSPVQCAREAVGLGLTLQKYGSRFFAKGGRPAGFLTRPERVMDKQRQTLREEWKEMHEGQVNFHQVGVLSGGWEWKEVGVHNNEAQFLESRKFQVIEIARWFRIPPHMLAELDRATFNNVEQLLTEFLVFTLFPWICRWEAELNMKLFTPKESFSYYVEHNIDGLLRPTTEAKNKAYETQLRNAIRTPNEIRKKENEAPYEGFGDKPLIMASQLMTLEDVESGKAMLPNSSTNSGGDSSPKNLDSRFLDLCTSLGDDQKDKLIEVLQACRLQKA